MESSQITKQVLEELTTLGRRMPSPRAYGLEPRPPIRVAITGAAGQIGGFLVHFIAQGRMFGQYQKVILHLIELPFAEKMLQGLIMELNDSAYRCVSRIEPYYDV